MLAWAGSTAAFTCYIVTDRNDNVIYRSTYPPVDLSDQGAPARERMRQRGEYLMFADLDTCPGVTFFTGAGGSRGLALDEVVNGMPALPSTGGARPVSGPNPNAAAAPARGGTTRSVSTPSPSGSTKRY